MQTYPTLDHLVGAYLHLDYYLLTGSDDINDAINLFLYETPTHDLIKLINEVDQFISQHKSHLDLEFDKEFSPGVTIDSAEEFLTMVKDKTLLHLAS